MAKSTTMPGTGDYVKGMISRVPEHKLLRMFTDQMAEMSVRETCKSNDWRGAEAALYAKSHPPNEK
ncbi:MAG: hypothetical protein K5837_03355 [Candidatus Saccharibacteria bacterium]|nr:hypothetical protein [Candidatus Saccharibacteria bacterium]